MAEFKIPTLEPEPSEVQVPTFEAPDFEIPTLEPESAEDPRGFIDQRIDEFAIGITQTEQFMNLLGAATRISAVQRDKKAREKRRAEGDELTMIQKLTLGASLNAFKATHPQATPERIAEVEARFRANFSSAADTKEAEAEEKIAGNVERLALMSDVRESIEPSEAMQQFQKAEGVAETMGVMIRNPEILLDFTSENLPSAFGVGALAIAGSQFGPGGTAGGAFLGGMAPETAGKMMEVMNEAGVDMTKPEEITDFLENPEKRAEAFDRGIRKGITISAINAGFAGLAGRWVGPAIGTGAGRVAVGAMKEAAVGLGGEAIGEIAGEVASGGTPSFKDTIAEMAGGGVNVAIEATSNVANEATTRRDQIAGPAEQATKLAREQIEQTDAVAQEAANAAEDNREAAANIGAAEQAAVENETSPDPDDVAAAQRAIITEANDAVERQRAIEATAQQAQAEHEAAVEQLFEAEEILESPEVQELDDVAQGAHELEIHFRTALELEKVNPSAAAQMRWPVAAQQFESQQEILGDAIFVEVESEDDTRVPGIFNGYTEDRQPIFGAYNPNTQTFPDGFLAPGEDFATPIPSFEEWQAQQPQPDEEIQQAPPQTEAQQEAFDETVVTIFKPEGFPGSISFDLPDSLIPEGGKRSQTPAEFQALGGVIPSIPDDLAQDQYSIGQLRRIAQERGGRERGLNPLAFDDRGRIVALSAQPAPVEQPTAPVEPDSGPAAAADVITPTPEQQVEPAEETIVKPQRSRGTQIERRMAKIGLPADGEPDIIWELSAIGGVPAPPQGTSKDDMANFRAQFPGIAEFLIWTNESGSKFGPGLENGRFDETVRTLLENRPDLDHTASMTDNPANGQFGVDEQVIEDVIAQIAPAVDRRHQIALALKTEDQTNDLEEALLGGEKKRKKDRSTRPISSDSLAKGDSFKVNGERYVVLDVTPEGQVVIEDGLTYTVAPNTDLFPDRKTVRRASRDVSFAPEDDPFGTIDPDAFVPPTLEPLPEDQANAVQEDRVPFDDGSMFAQHPEATQGIRDEYERSAGQQPVVIRSEDGTTQLALFNGWYNLPEPIGTKPSIGYFKPDAGFSHTLLRPGDTIVTPIPSFEEFSEGQRGELVRDLIPQPGAQQNVVEEGVEDFDLAGQSIEDFGTGEPQQAQRYDADTLTLEQVEEFIGREDYGGYDNVELRMRLMDLLAESGGRRTSVFNRISNIRQNNSHEQMRAKIGSLEGIRGIRLRDKTTSPNGVADEVLITRSADPDRKAWQATTIDQYGPRGHTEHNSLEAAIASYNGIRDPDSGTFEGGQAFEYDVADVVRQPDTQQGTVQEGRQEFDLEGQTDQEILSDEERLSEQLLRREQRAEMLRRAEAPLAPRGPQQTIGQEVFFAEDGDLFSGTALVDQPETVIGTSRDQPATIPQPETPVTGQQEFVLEEQQQAYADRLEITAPDRRAGSDSYVAAVTEPETDQLEFNYDLPSQTDEETFFSDPEFASDDIRRRIASGERISAVMAEHVSGEVPSFNIDGQIIANAKDFAVTQLALRSPYQESMKFAFLDENNRVIHSGVSSLGTLNSTFSSPGVFAQQYAVAQRKGATSMRLIISHNHPSGNTNPSSDDNSVWSRIKNWAENTVGGELVDSIVTDGDNFYSFADHKFQSFPERNIAAWEAVPRQDRITLTNTLAVGQVAATLRQGNPDGEFILFTDRSRRLQAVQQMAPESTSEQWSEQATIGAGATGSDGVLFITNRDRTFINTSRAAMALGDVELIDVSTQDLRSAKVAGVLEARPDFVAEEQTAFDLGDDETTAPSAEPPGPQPEVPTPPDESQGVRNLAARVISDENQPVELRDKLAQNPEIFYEKFSNRGLMEAARGASDTELEVMRNNPDKRVSTHALIEQANRASAAGDSTRAAELYAQAATIFTDPAQLLNVAKAVRNPLGLVNMVNTKLAQKDRKMTSEQEAQMLELSRKQIEAQGNLEQAAKQAEADFTEANEKAYQDARQAAGQADSDVRNFMQDLTPLSLTDLIIMTMQGNLLTPLSQITNVYGNIAFGGVRRSVKSMASAIDFGISTATGKPRKIKDPIPLPSQWQLIAAWDGARTVAKEIVTGPTAETYVRQEAQRGFRPLRAWVQAVSGEGLPVDANGNVRFSDRFKKIIEGTVGVPAEIMFRLLSFGDRPFRRAAEMEILEESARLQNLKGRELKKALLFPDDATKKRLETEGRKAIFTQENAAADMLQAMEDSLGRKLPPSAAGPIKVFGRIIAPYRQFPINFVTTAMSFALPEFGLARAVFRASKGDRRGAAISLSESVVGTMMYAGTGLMWTLGLISEPPDEESKRRSVQYEQMGPSRLNLSGLKRYLAGGDPTYRLGDRTMDWVKLGIPGAIFHIYTTGESRERAQQVKKGVGPDNAGSVTSSYLQKRLASFPGMGNFVMEQSFLAGTQAFLDALSEADPESPALQRWFGSVFRMVSSIPVPNTVEAVARAHYPYIPENRGDNLGETMSNVWRFKTFQMPAEGGEVLKRDFWGEPIPRAPEGSDPWLRQLFDVTKTEARGEDPFKQKLIDLYQSTEAPDVYPSMPSRTAYLNGLFVRLTPEDHEQLAETVGRTRRRMAENYVLDPRWETISEPARLQILSRIYERAGSVARKRFLTNPQIYNRYFNPRGDQSRMQRATGRGRRQIQRAQQPAQTP